MLAVVSPFASAVPTTAYTILLPTTYTNMIRTSVFAMAWCLVCDLFSFFLCFRFIKSFGGTAAGALCRYVLLFSAEGAMLVLACVPSHWSAARHEAVSAASCVQHTVRGGNDLGGA